MYLKALSHVPGQPSTFAALGYTYHLQVCVPPWLCKRRLLEFEEVEKGGRFP